MAQHPFEGAPVEFHRPVDGRIKEVGDPAVRRFGRLVPQQPAAHHRRQGQRDHRRRDDGDGQRERKFAEHAADQAGHE